MMVDINVISRQFVETGPLPEDSRRAYEEVALRPE
jgi:hypothetical protein